MDYQHLIQSTIEGSHQAFRQIMQGLEPAVAATVKGMLGDTQAAEDVGQETFIRLYRSLEKFRGESSLETYTIRIAINLSLNELKRLKRRKLFSVRNSEDVLASVADTSDPVGQSELGEAIYGAIDRLSSDFRSVVVLRLVNGYSVKETAELLDIPVGTVLSRLARAQKKLREELKSFTGVRL